MAYQEATGPRLAELRKQLVKGKLQVNSESGLLAECTDIACAPLPSELQLDQMNLLTVVLRQIRLLAATNETESQNLVYPRISAAFQPGGVLAELVLLQLDHHQKTSHIRAVEVLGAAAQLSRIVAPPASGSNDGSNFLDPLFVQTCRGIVTSKASLTIMSTLSDCARPSTALDLVIGTLLTDLAGTSTPSLLCSTIATLMSGCADSLEDASQGMLRKLLPYLDPEQPSIVATHMSRYLLPAMFEARPPAFPALLGMLASDESNSEALPFDSDPFAIWISVASIGVSRGLISVSDLPVDRIQDAMADADPAIRLKVFELLTGGKDNPALLSTARLDLLKTSIQLNAVLPDAGDRSNYLSALHQLLERVLQAENAARRMGKKAKLKSDDETESSAKEQQANADAFRVWLLTDLVDPGMRHARRPPVVRALLSLNLLLLMVGIFGDLPRYRAEIFTEDRVDVLISCQASEFTEVRNRAFEILASAPKPLPGYPTLEAAKTQALIDSAYRSFANPRKTQNDAATAALCIVYDTLILPAGSESAIAFVQDIVERLTNAINRLEASFGSGDAVGIHGLLSAIQAMLERTDLSLPDQQKAWRPILYQILDIVRRVWKLTKSVMSLAPSGSVDDAEGNNADRREHEIARAAEVLREGADDEDNAEVDTSRLISDSWRAIKEASELLATLVTVAVAAGSDQLVWQRDEVNDIGELYLEWLLEIRHRGTFSKVAVSFNRLVEAIKTDPNMSSLVSKWLERELQAITDDKISTTRRSAALPYSMLALVAGDEALVDHAVDRLISLGRIDNTATSDVTRVHAFNILKILLLDTKQAKMLHRHFERSVMTAVAAFASANWNVRNVGLILFSTLVHRVISPNRGSQDLFASRATLDARQTFASWHSKYPRILPFVADHIRAYQNSAKAMSGPASSQHTLLFPILIIVRSLRWHERASGIQDELREVIVPLLASHEWQVREVAAQALASLQDPSKAPQAIDDLLSRTSTPLEQNGLHGSFLLVGRLIESVLIASTLAATSLSRIESSLIEALESMSVGHTTSALVLDAMLTAATAFVTLFPESERLRASLMRVATEVIRASPRLPTPGFDLAQRTAAQISLAAWSAPDVIVEKLSQGLAEEARITLLEHLNAMPIVKLGQHSTMILLEMALDKDASDEVMTGALSVLGNQSSTDGALNDMSRRTHIDALIQVYRNKHCVPFREAALPAIAWCLSASTAENSLATVVEEVRKGSEANQSQPSRSAAIRTLRYLASSFMPGLVSRRSLDHSDHRQELHILLLQLLQDDDQDIRLEAAEIVSKALGRNRSVSIERARALWWEWLEAYLPSTIDEERSSWLRWLWRTCLDDEGYREDVASADPAGPVLIELFEVEKPNIFRNPLDDAENAAHILQQCPDRSRMPDDENMLTQRKAVLNHASQASDGRRACSPIEPAWEAATALAHRMDILRSATTSSAGAQASS